MEHVVAALSETGRVTEGGGRPSWDGCARCPVDPWSGPFGSSVVVLLGSGLIAVMRENLHCQERDLLRL